MMTAAGVSSIRNRFLFPAVLALFVVSSMVAVFRGYYPKTKENYRDSVSWIAAGARPGDGLVVHDQDTIIPVEYYLKKRFPDGIRLDCVYPAPFGRSDYLKTYPVLGEAAAGELKNRHGRTWVFLRISGRGDRPGHRARGFRAGRRYGRTERKDFGNLVVWRFAD